MSGQGGNTAPATGKVTEAPGKGPLQDKIFVVHGGNETIRIALVSFLKGLAKRANRSSVTTLRRQNTDRKN